MAGTPQQLWPITGARILIKKQKILKNTAIQEKWYYSYTQQVIGRDKGRALLHFKTNVGLHNHRKQLTQTIVIRGDWL